jgi:predicted DNA-binding protein (MmcQ/YjbR family)
MDIEQLKTLCESLPHVTTDIKWEQDLCFSIGGKMFFVMGLNNQPTKASFKVQEDEFDTICSQIGFSPAPYLARYKWVTIENISKISALEMKHFIEQSYSLIKNKLPLKIKKELNII